MATKRAYFTRNISGYVDVPVTHSNQQITDLVESSIKTIGLTVNSANTFIHKIHLPKRKVAI